MQSGELLDPWGSTVERGCLSAIWGHRLRFCKKNKYRTLKMHNQNMEALPMNEALRQLIGGI